MCFWLWVPWKWKTHLCYETLGQKYWKHKRVSCKGVIYLQMFQKYVKMYIYIYLHVHIYLPVHIQHFPSGGTNAKSCWSPIRQKKPSGKTQHVLNTKSRKINSHMKPNLNKAANSQSNAVRTQKYQKQIKHSVQFSKTKKTRMKKIRSAKFL